MAKTKKAKKSSRFAQLWEQMGMDERGAEQDSKRYRAHFEQAAMQAKVLERERCTAKLRPVIIQIGNWGEVTPDQAPHRLKELITAIAGAFDGIRKGT